MAEWTEDQQTRLGTAALFAALALALERSGKVRQEEVEIELQRMYGHLKDMESPNTGALDMVRWARELFKELK